ncbi:DUF6538 domain-containing protein, partial [Stenotrophomonas sp. SrG]|uniref:DUF6538 domain-containing protein n=1 Tax=Stenotrophomonas sp. SrG TaxID=3414430 RepID=UPI003CF8EC94
GTYAFRQRAPNDVHAVNGRKHITQPLRTANMASARLRAIGWASCYAPAYDVLRARRVARISTKDLDALAERLIGGG